MAKRRYDDGGNIGGSDTPTNNSSDVADSGTNSLSGDSSSSDSSNSKDASKAGAPAQSFKAKLAKGPTLSGGGGLAGGFASGMQTGARLQQAFSNSSASAPADAPAASPPNPDAMANGGVVGGYRSTVKVGNYGKTK